MNFLHQLRQSFCTLTCYIRGMNYISRTFNIFSLVVCLSSSDDDRRALGLTFLSLLPFPQPPSQDIASKTKTSSRLRRFCPTVPATIAPSKTRRALRRGSTALSTPEQQFSQGGMGAIFTHRERESLVFGMCPTVEHANALCTQQQHSLDPH